MKNIVHTNLYFKLKNLSIIFEQSQAKLLVQKNIFRSNDKNKYFVPYT